MQRRLFLSGSYKPFLLEGYSVAIARKLHFKGTFGYGREDEQVRFEGDDPDKYLTELYVFFGCCQFHNKNKVEFIDIAPNVVHALAHGYSRCARTRQ